VVWLYSSNIAHQSLCEDDLHGLPESNNAAGVELVFYQGIVIQIIIIAKISDTDCQKKMGFRSIKEGRVLVKKLAL